MTVQISFQEPLAGLGSFTEYDFAPLDGARDTYTLRASAQPTIRLFLVDAAAYLPDYVGELDRPADRESGVFLVVTPHADGVTVNLLAPLFIDPDTRTGRQVIATDFQGHGRTNDVDRPLRSADLAADVVGLLRHLDVPQADVFGFSIGGAAALHLAIGHPELVRKLIVSSAAFHPDGMRPENKEAVGRMTVEMIAGTPMEQAYRAKSPHPDRLQTLLDKLGGFDEGVAGWSDADIEGIPAPTLITVGDCDAVRLDHALRFVRLRGGDVNGDFAGVPASQLAVLPGTTHFFGLARTALVLDVVLPFLDADMPSR